MKLVDDAVAALEALTAPQTKRPDFDEFWSETLSQVKSVPLNVQGGRVDHPFPSYEVRDLTVDGLDGTPVRVWMILPAASRDGPVPCVIHYHGAGGHRDLPSAHTLWPSMGAALVTMDFRMQGGLTGSRTGFTGHSHPGWFTLGVRDKRASYFYHTWTDALRCVELALGTPEIDSTRVAVHGGSQGGAASLAVAALHDAVGLCMADVPSNCWLEKRLFDRAGGMSHAADLVRQHPDAVEAVCETLSYFDNLNLAERIRCPVLVSCGLKDPVCPAANVYAAYNRIVAPKEICCYPFGEHGGGGSHHAEKKLRFFAEHFLRAQERHRTQVRHGADFG